jgi:hypothetical protein
VAWPGSSEGPLDPSPHPEERPARAPQGEGLKKVARRIETRLAVVDDSDQKIGLPELSVTPFQALRTWSFTFDGSAT